MNSPPRAANACAKKPMAGTAWQRPLAPPWRPDRRKYEPGNSLRCAARWPTAEGRNCYSADPALALGSLRSPRAVPGYFQSRLAALQGGAASSMAASPIHLTLTGMVKREKLYSVVG